MAIHANTATPFAAQREEEPAYRLVPHNIEAEQALIGALLVNNEVWDRVSSFLEPHHFYEGVHARIYEIAGRRITGGQSATPVTLKTFFDNDPALAELDGARYLARLAAAAVNTTNAVDFAHTIHDLAVRRELIRIGEEVMETAFDSPIDLTPAQQIVQAESHLFSLAERGRYEGGFKAFSTALAEAIEVAAAAYERDGGLSGLSTGLTDLDQKLGGLHPSDLIILAGRPSMGKTALATQIAFNIAKDFVPEVDTDGTVKAASGGRVGFFSLEMSAEQLASRLLSQESEISSEKIRRGQVTEEEFQRLAIAAQRVEAAPLFIDDTPALPISTLLARARRLKRQHGLDLVVVDYLQLLRPGGASRADNRVQELSEITQGLKAMAKELSVPVIALSQLSRAVESREDKRPQLSDLRESGSIEQDADVVTFVFREEYYLGRAEPREGTPEHADWQEKMSEVYGKAEVIIGKQRHGPIGTVALQFQGEFTRFGNLVDAGRLPERTY
ncbi:replicative DNA helicase [Futiania mangrovi]|uniref:Replicative DNA helicase n=1 Tax=Futiania mangrovi TaxID=2959716 RepID=A0A9J6PD77_9PROT|nr:replicative DNA helicase [Futiania mangrovii]MCP1335635.1 replicative DNA helicase [Futiania mangrovii]